MNCPQCGATNEEGARFCMQCGSDLQRAGQQAPPPAPDPYAQPAQTYAQPVAPQAPQQAQPLQQQYQQPQYQQAPQQTSYAPPAYAPPAYAPQYQPAYTAMPKVASHLVWAILCFFLTFWPTAIVAIVFAAQVSGKLTRGDFEGAKSASKNAKIWCWVSFGIAVVMWIIIIVALVAVGASVSTSSSFNY